MTERRNWAAWVLVAWGVLFAVPSFVWAMGGSFGARSTVAPELVRMAQERVPWFVAVLWLTGLLKLFAAAVGVCLTRPRPPRVGRFAALCGGGAATLLVGHGLLFVVEGALVKAGVVTLKADLSGLIGWYLYLWGPYFVLGGLASGAATVWYLRRTPDRPRTRAYGMVGAAGGLLVVLASVVAGLG